MHTRERAHCARSVFPFIKKTKKKHAKGVLSTVSHINKFANGPIYKIIKNGGGLRVSLALGNEAFMGPLAAALNTPPPTPPSQIQLCELYLPNKYVRVNLVQHLSLVVHTLAVAAFDEHV